MTQDKANDRELLKPYREEIDAIDDQLVDLLVKRFDIVREVGRLKTEKSLTVVQSARVVEVIERNAQRAASKGFDPDVVRQIYTLLIDYAHRLEHKIMDAR